MKILICVPTYNERGNIARLLGRLLNIRPDIDILVIDDNSPDGTGEMVEGFSKQSPRIKLLRREKKRGIGPAYVAGFRWGLERGYDVFVEMDADLSHRPRYLPKFFEAIERYDLVVGSRWMKGGRIANWAFRRILLSRLANIYCRWVLQVPVFDMTAGFVCYRREVLERLDLTRIHSDGYSFQIEMKYRALQHGFKLLEIPIAFTNRKDGNSKISRRIVFEALLMVWVLKLFPHKELT